MSDSVIKGERKASARTSASSQRAIPAVRDRKQASTATRPAKLAPRSSPTAKRPAQKASKPPVSASSKAKTAAKERPGTVKSAKAVSIQTQAKPRVAPAGRGATKASAQSGSKVKNAKAPVAQAAKPSPKKQVVPAKQVKQSSKALVAQTKAVASTVKSPTKSARGKQSGASVPTHSSPPAAIVRGKTRDDAAALEDFRRAHQQFARGRFAEAAASFRSIIERFPGVSEVTARARTYVAVAESRLRTQKVQPISDDAIYDRGVVELNRANYTAAQEMFERALQQDERAAHVHYGLAAARARLGSRASALESLERAIELQPSLRVRASQDADLASLRVEAEFERVVFSSRQ